MESYQSFIERKKEQTKKRPRIKFKDIGRKGFFIFEKEKCTLIPQHNLEKKVFIIERLKLVEIQKPVSHKKIKIGDIEYRFGYYIIGKNGKAKGRWTWGQYCPIIPGSDLKELLSQARREKTLLI